MDIYVNIYCILLYNSEMFNSASAFLMYIFLLKTKSNIVYLHLYFFCFYDSLKDLKRKDYIKRWLLLGDMHCKGFNYI